MKKYLSLLLIITMLLPMAVYAVPAGLGEYTITADVLNVRSEPTASSTQLGSLYLGDRVEVLEIANGYWGRIIYNDAEAWISLNYATRIETKEYIITSPTLNVRSGPDSSYQALGVLYMGDRVEVYEIANGYWGRIIYNDAEAWISLNYATRAEAKTMTISENGLSVLKGLEGFSKMAYWDYSQWSIGYGTRCEENEYPDGITEEEASELLVKALSVYESYLDGFLDRNSITVTQGQYDALVSFTYNLGNVWVSSKEVPLRDMLINGVGTYSEQEIRDAFGTHVTAGGQVNNGLVYRRKVEADLFLSDTVFTPVHSFEDVKNTAWYADEVSYCVKNGYMKGMSETVFSPNSNVTREQFVLILANMAGVDTNNYKEVDSGMGDIPTGQWYSGAVSWAVQSGYVSGVAEGVFGRGQPIQRAALARLLYLYAAQTGKDVSGRADLSGFGDFEIINHKNNSWMVTPLQWAVDSGIISGMNDGFITRLHPKSTATRAQCARMLMQFDKID